MPPNLRGTYGGLSSPAMIEHLKRLGVTTVELLPIHGLVDDRVLVERKLVNYWGYNTLSFFAPEPRYSQDNPLDAFRTTVARLHDAGIEVMLDVVYNHTARGRPYGPDAVVPRHRQRLLLLAEAGQSAVLRRFHRLRQLGQSHPSAGACRWSWIRCATGWRSATSTAFASTSPPRWRAGRTAFARNTGFFAAIRQDPVLSAVKLVAEPWDLGMGGYQVGAFPSQWSEWNDRYRSAMRRYWSGEGSLIGEVSGRMTGSSDLFNHDGRAPAPVSITSPSHDGFTLADLFSYNEKHNEANGEDNRDGTNENHSNNCGQKARPTTRR